MRTRNERNMLLDRLNATHLVIWMLRMCECVQLKFISLKRIIKETKQINKSKQFGGATIKLNLFFVIS